MFRKKPSYTLQEMLLVLAILGILISIALPLFLPLIAKTKSTEAQTQLKYIANLQTQHMYLNAKYSMDFNDIDFVAPQTVNNGGTANYSYTVISSSINSFKARAEAVVDFDGDGVFNVWEIDENGKPIEIVKD